MLTRFVSFLLFFLVFLSSETSTITLAAQAGGGLTTNAKRLAAGLPPLPPVKRWSGSKVQLAKRAGASPLPPIGFTRHVSVYRPDGFLMGYIRRQTTGNGLYSLVQGLYSGATAFSTVVNPIGTTNQLNLQDAFDNGFLGTNVFSSIYLLPSNNNIASLRRVLSSSPPGATGLMQSALWTYDATTMDLTAQYVNPDGSKPPTFIVYDYFSDSFGLTSNPAALVSSSVLPVTFKFNV